MAELATVSASSVAALSATLGAAVAAQVLQDDGTGLRFRHDLIHEAIYMDVPASIRIAWHRDAAHRLADAGAHPQVVAAQMLRSALPGDTEAIEQLARAARDIAPGFPDVGAELFERALDLLETPGTVRDELVVERADALVRAGLVSEAIPEFCSVLGRSRDPDVEFGIRLRLGPALTIAGEPARALEQLAVVSNSDVVTAGQRRLSWAETGTAYFWLGDLDRAEEFSERAGAEAIEVGDEHIAYVALGTITVVAALRAEFDTAMEISDRALHRAEARTDRSRFTYPLHATRGFLFIEMDRFDEARSALDDGRDLCEKIGVRWPLPVYQAYIGVKRFIRGVWDDAISELETSRDLIEETGVSFAAALVHTTLAVICVHRGDLVGAARAVRAADEVSARGPQHFRPRIGWVTALLHEAHEDADLAEATLADGRNHCVENGTAMDFPLLGPDLVRLSVANGHRDLAERVVKVVEDTALASAVPSRRAAAQRCRGLLQDDPAALADAADGYASAGRWLEAALAGQEAAVSFVKHGEPERARTHFDTARQVFERLHARRDLLRLDAQLRTAGMPRGNRGPRHRPTTGWASLTETERAVANLVAEGLTNPQIGARLFVSRRTVQTHVSHIFTKLDLSSRTQIAAMVAGRQDPAH